MTIYENERIDYVNDSLSLIQKTDGLTFGTDALLLAGYANGKYEKAAEIGGGSGIISMLMLARGKISTADAIEVQEEYADLIRRNAELNRLTDRLIERKKSKFLHSREIPTFAQICTPLKSRIIVYPIGAMRCQRHIFCSVCEV